MLENVLMLVITIGQAIVYVYTGMYGDPAAVGIVNSVLIVFQVGRICLGVFCCLFSCLCSCVCAVAEAWHMGGYWAALALPWGISLE